MRNSSILGSTLLLAATGALFIAAPTAHAQVPPGWGVFAVHEWWGASRGDMGGLGLFDPRGKDRWIAIQGLPTGLTGTGWRIAQGANCVLIRPTDGTIFAGELAPASEASVEIYQITLRGDRVDTLKRFPIGKPIGGPSSGTLGAVETMFWLPDGRIGFAYRGIGAPLKSWHGVAILDPASGAVLEVPIQNLPASKPVTAAVADAGGRNLYFIVFQPGSTIVSEVWTVPITGGTARLLAKLTNFGAQIEYQPDGKLLVGIGAFPANPGLVTIDPATGKVTPIVKSGLSKLDSSILDRGIDRILGFGERNTRFGIYAYDRLGTFLGTVVDRDALPQTGLCAAARSGAISGMAIRPTVEPYGRDHAATYRYAWDVHPGPEPTVGNLAFTVAVQATGKPDTAFLAVADRAADVPSPLSFRWQIDPARLLGLLPLTAAQRIVQPLPVPPDMSVQGLTFFCQLLALDPGGFAASRGLRLTIK